MDTEAPQPETWDAQQPPLEEQLAAFLRSARPYPYTERQWIGTAQVAVYLRTGKRLLVPLLGLSTVLEIASVDVREPWQRHGIFRSFLASAERLNPYEAIFVENILNPYLLAFLFRQGYQASKAYSGLSPCVYKFTKREPR